MYSMHNDNHYCKNSTQTAIEIYRSTSTKVQHYTLTGIIIIIIKIVAYLFTATNFSPSTNDYNTVTWITIISQWLFEASAEKNSLLGVLLLPEDRNMSVRSKWGWTTLFSNTACQSKSYPSLRHQFCPSLYQSGSFIHLLIHSRTNFFVFFVVVLRRRCRCLGDSVRDRFRDVTTTSTNPEYPLSPRKPLASLAGENR